MQKWSFAPFATPLLLAALHACGAAPGDVEGEAVSEQPAAVDDAPPVAHEEAPLVDTPVVDVNGGGYLRAQIPWVNGTHLVGVLDAAEDFAVPTFHVEDGDAPAPDFSGLRFKQGQGSRYYITPAYASILEEPEVLIFDEANGDGGWTKGIFRWSPRAGARFEELPVPKGYGAFAPVAILARATDDVWAGAAIKREGFEKDFPGCPSSVWASLDDVYLAHWDGRAWTHVATPHFMGRLRTMSFADDGTLTLETGWTSEERQAQGLTEEEAQADTSTWTLSAQGVWKKG